MTEHQPEVWTYLGQRVNYKGGRCHKWLDGAGRDYVFTKISATVIGGQYEIQVLRGEDGEFTSAQIAVNYNGMGDPAQVPQWQAEDRLAKLNLARARLAKADARRDSIAEACIPLIEIRRACCRTSADRRAFAVMVLDYLVTLD